MIKDFDIRTITSDDLPQLQAVLRSSSHDWSDSILMSCFGSNYYQWGIFFQTDLLGFVVIKSIDHCWEIMQIAIDANYQQQGLATRLLQFVATVARKKNIHKMQLEVRSSNTAAIQLYHKMQFTEVGVRKKYYANGENAVLMDCIL